MSADPWLHADTNGRSRLANLVRALALTLLALALASLVLALPPAAGVSPPFAPSTTQGA